MTLTARIAQLERRLPPPGQQGEDLGGCRLLLEGEAAAAVLAFYEERGEPLPEGGSLATVLFHDGAQG